MTTVNFEIPNEQLDRVVNNFSEYHGYRVEIQNPDFDSEDPESPEKISNPQTRAQFVKAKIVDFVKESVRANETAAAINAAKVTITDTDVA